MSDDFCFAFATNCFDHLPEKDQDTAFGHRRQGLEDFGGLDDCFARVVKFQNRVIPVKRAGLRRFFRFGDEIA